MSCLVKERMDVVETQDEAFAKVKSELTKPTVLALFDVNTDLKISADASSY